ncbi:MAG: MFS transporter [Candidatus Eisenbacteria bacterium RBG_16_71_46]|nr:MAG: MFS transporter [Candidatus Eisenbacteria bacterium RBG_16_71_46]
MGDTVRRPLLNESERPTRTHFIILGMSWAGWLFDFYDLMLFAFLLVPIKKSLGLDDVALSLLLGASLAATAMGGIAFGYLADRFGRRIVLSWTIGVYSLGAFLCGFAGGFYSLLVFRIVTGLGVGGEWATGQTLVGETFPARMRARYAAVMQTGAPLGIALAALVGGFLEPAFAAAFGDAWGWRACFYVSVAPALLVMAIRRYMPESDVWLERRRLRQPRERGQLAELLLTPRLRRLFLLGLVLALTDMSAYWFTYSWLPKYLYDQLGYSMARSGVWMLVTQAGGLIGYLSFGVFADAFGRRVSYTAYSLIWAVGLVAVTLFWSQIAVWPYLTLFFMFVVGLGTGNFSGYGPIFAEIFPTKIRNTAMGTAFNLARGVQFLTPLVIAQVATRYGLGGGISLAALFAVFTGLWVWTLPETRGTRIGVGDTVPGR